MDNTIKALNTLIQLDYDAAATYARAIDWIDEALIRTRLHEFRKDHLDHVTSLSAVVMSLGGTPPAPTRDVKGVVLEGVTALRSLGGTPGALKAMRMNEKLTNHAYDVALATSMPLHVIRLVERHRDDERSHLAYLEAMLIWLEQHVRIVDGDQSSEAEEARPS